MAKNWVNSYQRPWPLTGKIQLVNSWTQVNACAQFGKFPLLCLWDIAFITTIGHTDWRLEGQTWEHNTSGHSNHEFIYINLVRTSPVSSRLGQSWRSLVYSKKHEYINIYMKKRHPEIWTAQAFNSWNLHRLNLPVKWPLGVIENIRIQPQIQSL